MPDEEKTHSQKNVSSCSLKGYREIRPKYRFNNWRLGSNTSTGEKPVQGPGLSRNQN